jgi:hypothetical protein
MYLKPGEQPASDLDDWLKAELEPAMRRPRRERAA